MNCLKTWFINHMKMLGALDKPHDHPLVQPMLCFECCLPFITRLHLDLMVSTFYIYLWKHLRTMLFIMHIFLPMYMITIFDDNLVYSPTIHILSYYHLSLVLIKLEPDMGPLTPWHNSLQLTHWFAFVALLLPLIYIHRMFYLVRSPRYMRSIHVMILIKSKPHMVVLLSLLTFLSDNG